MAAMALNKFGLGLFKYLSSKESEWLAALDGQACGLKGLG